MIGPAKKTAIAWLLAVHTAGDYAVIIDYTCKVPRVLKKRTNSAFMNSEMVVVGSAKVPGL